MSRYIDADALKDKITQLDGGSAIDGIGYDIFTREVFELIDEVPTADVRENVKGEWIPEIINIPFCDIETGLICDTETGLTLFKCSICDYREDGESKFCANCGADMRKGD